MAMGVKRHWLIGIGLLISVFALAQLNFIDRLYLAGQVNSKHDIILIDILRKNFNGKTLRRTIQTANSSFI